MPPAPAAGSPHAAPNLAGLVYVQPLGSGGYADVYLYEQQSPRMPVAVKVLKAGTLSEKVRAEFIAEADTMAALGDHPYIVQVFRAGTADDGRPYLVMKYYPPPNLAQRSRAERFALGDVLRIGIQLASAVQTAHQAQVIHRDIKPANVLVSAYGAPGLTDFGIAGRGLRTRADAVVQGVSAREEIGVSVPWSAPEVVYGESDGDERSDIYSLGATLWQLLVGRSPFEVPGGDNTAYALMPRIRTQPVPPTKRPDVPASLERLLTQAMAKDPALRPQSALEFAHGLQAIEQECRLPRTQVLVLDDRGRARLFGPGAPGAGADALADTDQSTHVKGPQRVEAQRPAPPVPPASVPTATPTPQATGMPSAPAAPGYPPVPPPPRVHAPSAASGWPTVPPPPAPAAASAASSAAPSSLAGAPTAIPDPTADPTPLTRWEPVEVDAGMPSADSQPGRASVGRRIGTVAAGVAAFAASWWLVSTFALGGGRTADSGPTPTAVQTLKPTTDGSAIGDGVFVAPSVQAVGAAGVVRFTWNYDGPSSKDTYRVGVGATAAEAIAAAPTTLTGARAKEVVAPAGTQVCVVVSVVRSGQISPTSVPSCALAG